MTKKETDALLEAVKNAPIVNNQITVTVCGTTFTFGCPFKQFNGDRRITEGSREEWLEQIAVRCRMRFTSSISKKELDEPGLRTQNGIVYKMLHKYVIDKNLKTKKESENFYFVMDTDKQYKLISRENIYPAIEFAKSIGKRRGDVFKVQV